MSCPATRRAGSALGLASLVLSLACLCSCSYLLDDPYPAFAQRVLASTDLDAAVRQVSGGSGIEFARDLYYLESGASTAVFVQLTTKDAAARLLALDGGSLTLPVGYTYGVDSIGAGVGLSTAGQFVSGAVAMDPQTRLEAAAVPNNPGQLLSEAGINYFATSTGTALRTRRLDTTWSALSTLNIPISSTGSWQLSAAGQGGGWYCFLFQLTGSSSFRAFRTPSLASMAWTSLFDDTTVPADYTTPLFTADPYSVWITSDGPVLRGNSSSGGDSLGLVRFGSSLASVDYSPRSAGPSQYFFEPSGRYWFIYESGTARLFKLRTWWK